MLGATSKKPGRVHSASKGQVGEIPIVGSAAANDCGLLKDEANLMGSCHTMFYFVCFWIAIKI